MIYYFTDLSSINKENARNIVSIISAEQPFFVFPLSEVRQDYSTIVIGITSVSKTNNESSLSNVLKLKRINEEWQIQ